MKESIKNLKHPLPSEPDDVADYLAEAAAKQAGAVKRNGGAWWFELADGTPVDKIGDDKTVFRFITVGGRIPEEGFTGDVISEFGPASAEVVHVGGKHVFLAIENAPESLPEVVLEVDPAQLLTDLSAHMEAVSRDYYDPESPVAGLFDSGSSDPKYAAAEPDAKVAFLWSPPGVDWTVEAADLAYTWSSQGEKVLVCCRNGTETDVFMSACLDLAEPENLTEMAGRYLRIGWSPPSSGLRDLLISEYRAGLEDAGRRESDETAGNLDRLEQEKKLMEKDIQERNRCDDLAFRAEDMESRSNRLVKELKDAEILLAELEDEWRRLLDRVERLDRAMLFRKKRRQAVLPTYRQASKDCHDARNRVRRMKEELAHLRIERERVRGDWEQSSNACKVLPPLGEMEAKLAETVSGIEQCHRKLENAVGRDASSDGTLLDKVISRASVVFSPLTATMSEMNGLAAAFDRVLITGVETAPAPLVFLAAKRARQGVVLAGDYVERAPSGPWLGAGREIMADVLAKGCEATVYRNRESAPPVQNRMNPVVAEVVRELAYRETGMEFGDDPRLINRSAPDWIDADNLNSLVFVDTSGWGGWCGRERATLSGFNLRTAMAAAHRAADLAGSGRIGKNGEGPRVFIVTPYTAQAGLIAAFLQDLNAAGSAECGTPESFAGRTSPLVLFDTVLDTPQVSARLASPAWPRRMSGELAAAVALAEFGIEIFGSAAWMETNAHPKSALAKLKRLIGENAEIKTASVSLPSLSMDEPGIPDGARKLFGIIPDFQSPHRSALEGTVHRVLEGGGEVVLLVSPIMENGDHDGISESIEAIRRKGGVVAMAKGVSGPELVVDGQGFLFGQTDGDAGFIAMKAPRAATEYLRLIQAEVMRDHVAPDGAVRLCPRCNGPLVVVNQERQQGPWDRQAVKLACENDGCGDYLRNIDERPPFKVVPVCRVNSGVRYERVRRGRTEMWECPDHPAECPPEPVVPGDPV